MPSPIEYLAIRQLQTALKAIAVASGYHFTLAGTAVKLDPNQSVEALSRPGGSRPFIVIEVKPEAWGYFPASQIELTIPATVHWISEGDVTVDEKRMETYFQGCADVERAIGADVTLAGLVTDVRIVKRTMDLPEDGAEVWALIDVELTINRTYGAPDA